jgi:hypothetical protein
MPDIVTGLAGGLLIVGGLAMIFVFPDLNEYQSKAFSYTGILIGTIMAAVGVGLMVFT